MKAWDWGGFFEYLVNPYLLQGAFVTLGLTVAAIAGGLVVGCLLSLLRLSSHKWMVAIAKGYIWIFRGTPLLVQLIIIYTGLPQLGIKFSVLESALLGLVLNEAAYLAEIIRGGILGVSAGQSSAARALGLNSAQTMMYVVLPQAIRIIIPALGNSINGLLKTTSITSVISMEELLRKTQILIQEKFLVLELFAVAALYYLLLTSVWDIIQRRIEARYGRAYKSISVNEGH
ncbi:MAG: amino acid ABC transporter permease [Ramlibacter sp.]|jgi:polar amino acid transport system permease protein|uniref:amino acid ABC transporter permease n=1 Tax=Ramlibacter sp. TaxID=1917967 RepID=UPI0026376FEC|nr:amino acid ABC transporter permease [Ramlibacter sp.]MDH4375942.1 amino acid ABC transporter permease [Ramlibacter sp.]